MKRFSNLCLILTLGISPLLFAPARAQTAPDEKLQTQANTNVLLLAKPLPPLPKCKRKQRPVRLGTPILGGPGLGYDIIKVIEKTACFRKLQTSSDGSFMLITLEKEKKVGWVATGLVDVRLSTTDAQTAALIDQPEPASGEVKAVRPLVLRSSPRFDALAIATPIAKGTALTVKGSSKDGQWLLVEAPATAARPIGDTTAPSPQRGWVPKYKVAQTLLKPEDKATAGTGSWSETRLGRKSSSDLSAQRVSSDLSAQRAASSKTSDLGPSQTDKGKDDKAKDEKVAGDKTAADQADADKASADGDSADGAIAAKKSATDKVLGRTQEIAVHFGYRYWQQDYSSDAFNDGFYKYNWVAPVGAELGGSYAFRGDLPIVVEVRGVLGFSGWQHPGLLDVPAPEGEDYPVPAYVADPDPAKGGPLLSAQLNTSVRVAYRLFSTASVDVDAGASASLDAFLNYNTAAAVEEVQTLVSGIYAAAGPSLAARSRIGENGKFGLLIVEAQLPIGLYTMLPDPGAAYFDRVLTPNQAEPFLLPEATGAGMIPDANNPPDPNALPPDELRPKQGLPFHLGVGVDGRVRYQYAFSHLLRIEVQAGVLLRQASITGPGYRTGLYNQANNIDIVASLGLGMTFGL